MKSELHPHLQSLGIDPCEIIIQDARHQVVNKL